MLERYAQLPRGAQPFTESQGSVQVAGTGDHLASTEGSSAIRILHDDAHTQQGCEDATGDGSCLMPTRMPRLPSEFCTIAPLCVNARLLNCYTQLLRCARERERSIATLNCSVATLDRLSYLTLVPLCV